MCLWWSEGVCEEVVVHESALYLKATREALSCVVKPGGPLFHFTLQRGHLGASGNAGSNSGGLGPRAEFLTALFMTLVMKLVPGLYFEYQGVMETQRHG